MILVNIGWSFVNLVILLSVCLYLKKIKAYNKLYLRGFTLVKVTREAGKDAITQKMWVRDENLGPGQSDVIRVYDKTGKEYVWEWKRIIKVKVLRHSLISVILY